MESITKPSQLVQTDLETLKWALSRLAQLANGNSRAHGFWDDYDDMYNECQGMGLMDSKTGLTARTAKYILDTRLSKIALIHSELGEMTEGVRKPGPDDHIPGFSQEEAEAADVFIRLMDYVGEFGLRFEEAVLAKMEYNASRPYKHGKGA